MNWVVSRTAPSDNYTLAVDVRGDAEGIDGQFKEGSFKSSRGLV